MEYVNLGRFGARVSRLCLGTMNFGPQTSEPDSHAIMDRALEHGINFFDTANVYGWRIAAANGAARRRHFLGLTSEQCLYNLLDRSSELEVLPAAEAYGMGAIP